MKNLLFVLLLVSSTILGQEKTYLIKHKGYQANVLQEIWRDGKEVFKKTNVIFYFSKDGKYLYTDENDTQLKKFIILPNTFEPIEGFEGDYVSVRVKDAGGFKPFLIVQKDANRLHETAIIFEYYNMLLIYYVNPVNKVPLGHGILLDYYYDNLPTGKRSPEDDEYQYDPYVFKKLMELNLKIMANPFGDHKEKIQELSNDLKKRKKEYEERTGVIVDDTLEKIDFDNPLKSFFNEKKEDE